MYPAWKSTFDAHIYEGRVLEVVLMQNSEEPLAKATMGVSVLAERCKQSKTSGRAEFWLDLHPSGKVQMAVQFFLEDSDAGKTALNERPLKPYTIYFYIFHACFLCNTLELVCNIRTIWLWFDQMSLTTPQPPELCCNITK